MNHMLRSLILAALVAILALPLIAQDQREQKKKRGKKGAGSPVAALMRQLDQAELSEDQSAKIKEIVAEHEPKIAAAGEKLNLTDEQRAARAQASKKADDDGLKGKQRQDAINEAMKLTDEQKAAIQEQQDLVTALRRAVGEVLTEEQREKAGFKGRKKKGGG